MRVHVVGTGLIGTSLGLALTRHGDEVTLEDAVPTHAALARDLGAGRLPGEGETLDPQLVVVAAPPDVTAGCVATALERWPSAAVTDVASVKGAVLARLRAADADLGRYCGSHPMAGRERSGAVSGRHDLFDGRAWVLTPTAETRPQARELVADVARAAGAAVLELPPEGHDRAVAVVSHVPQLAASLVAARLETLDEDAVALAGQGLRDVTRIAASDPHLWTQILAGNAPAVREVLAGLAEDLDRLLEALAALADGGDAPGARGALAGVIAAGNLGQARIPGKHGAAPTSLETVRVLLPDEPGQLGRLFADIGAIGVNVEEFHLDHGLGQQLGLAEVEVLPAAAAGLAQALGERGWRIHG
ncbi:prephenate dehydrogenase [Phycicoccus endophyticus]|uniref:Prephenate dehydrogenase n=1 Tax=Phycicoccus endophyticus TaxID=1690220 RepID=A0A7G9R4N6_9MICO|nr:prephenate dehydrogenase [Phycicoccus endophyticus]NHI18464.1 prephenate dehydrogenase [Phycicoccus endophyticus]QNN50561.1 prephenate dehydrogenase [Phycicoccus endophyticus]GGL23565.1 prephenate dehydrogenase [Phycicoccus endophyticus]